MSQNSDLIVGTLRIRLVIRSARSLKDKRQTVKSLKDRIRSRFNASVAEIGALDVYQTAILGVAVVANDSDYVRSVLTQIANLASTARDAELAAADMEIL